MTLGDLIKANIERAERWHAGTEWSCLEWAGAMCGEAGEAANAAKKLRRLEQEIIPQALPIPVSHLKQDQRFEVAKECADTVLYALLLCHNVGYDFEDVIRHVFNKKSEQMGFPEHI